MSFNNDFHGYFHHNFYEDFHDDFYDDCHCNFYGDFRDQLFHVFYDDFDVDLGIKDRKRPRPVGLRTEKDRALSRHTIRSSLLGN